MREYAEHALRDLALIGIGGLFAGWWLAALLRRRGLRWTWALVGVPAGYLLLPVDPLIAVTITATTVLGTVFGAAWHGQDLHHGADIADTARARTGPLTLIHRAHQNRRIRRHGWIQNNRLIVGNDEQGLPASIPAGRWSGSHTLVLGATGAGKTVTETWITTQLIETGHAAVVVDPKGDQLLHQELEHVTHTTGRRFLEWTPQGPCTYNPYGHGTESEIADKALAGEEFTEPHYLRQAQRYLAHAVRTLHTTRTPVTPVSLAAHLDPGLLEHTTRQLPAEHAGQVDAYLDGLTERQKRDLGGVRDRLSILAESDIHHWLQPRNGTPTIDIHHAIHEKAVVYFRLDADRRPLLSQMIGAAILSDLVTLIGTLQALPVPTVVLIDEFAAISSGQVARLFGRARSAGVSLVLGTQELADLAGVGDGTLKEQTLGNVSTVVAHRQNVPESAELIAQMAGTRAAWVTTQQTQHGFLISPGEKGSKRRGYEYEIHPSRIKQLPTGTAALITPGTQRPLIARMHHPNVAHQLRHKQQQTTRRFPWVRT